MALIGQAVSEEKIFDIVDDGRTPEHGHPISSPFEPSAQVSLKYRQRPDMALAVDWDGKHQFKQTNKQINKQTLCSIGEHMFNRNLITIPTDKTQKGGGGVKINTTAHLEGCRTTDSRLCIA